MAKVTFLPDRVAPPVDAKLEEIGGIATLAGREIRLRLQPDLYHHDKQGYVAWAGLTWTLELEDIEEGRRFREALGRFMAAFGDERQGKVIEMLEGL